MSDSSTVTPEIVNPEVTPANDNVSSTITAALIQFFYMLAFILVLCPFKFWKRSAANLADARQKPSWAFASKSRWPYFSFVKAVMLNFVFDGLSFISWFVGIVVALYYLGDGLFSSSDSYWYYENPVAAGFKSFFMVLFIAYYAPMYVAPLRDLFVMLLMPIQKFLSWCSKPAQQLDLDIRQK